MPLVRKAYYMADEHLREMLRAVGNDLDGDVVRV
jgi:hypothetical protein